MHETMLFIPNISLVTTDMLRAQRLSWQVEATVAVTGGGAMKVPSPCNECRLWATYQPITS